MTPSNLNSPAKALAAAMAGGAQPSLSAPATVPPSVETITAHPVLSIDLEGKITGCNIAALELFGRSPQELLGRQLAALLESQHTSSEQSQLQQKLISTVLREDQFEDQRTYRKASGEQIDVELCLTLLRDGRLVPTGMVAWFAPVSQKVERSPIEHQAINDQSAEHEEPAPKEQTDDESAHTVTRKIDGSSFVLASPLMHRFMGMVERVAGHTESVLITGETGTGKELIARTIHQSSNRRSRPWIDINCAALPENLVESELFGYEKGAFTGADASKPGLFEMADRGTLFLDEIGELQLHTQVKLLRVLDGYPFYRLGGHRKINVDVRIVTATNQNLEAGVAAGRFREDLFHRLGQFQLRVPPLRERPEDIVALSEHFLGLKNPGSSFVPDAISTLLSYSWPGNVRELRNLVARVAVQSSRAEIQAAQITAAMSGSPTVMRQTASVPVGNLDSMEEQMIIRALERSGGHRGQAADQLGISRRTLSRKLKEYKIDVKTGEGGNSLGVISLEQQKFFRARVQLSVILKNPQGEEACVQGVNLSTGGLGVDGLKEPMRFSGLLDVSFKIPDTEIIFSAKARIVWMGDEGRVGLRFAVIDPALFEQLQRWTNRKMKDEGWDLPPETEYPDP